MAVSRTKIRDIATDILNDKRQGITLPTDLEALLVGEYVELEYFDSAVDFDGRTELCRGKPAIYVNGRYRDRADGRTRFTLAHEIGHLYLHGSMLRMGMVFVDDRIDPDHLVDNDYEAEANAFASEVLFPVGPLAEYRRQVLSLSVAVKLADRAGASLQAAAILLATISRDRCCFFLEQDGQVRWCAPTEDWRRLGLPCKKFVGHALPGHSWSAKHVGHFEEQTIALSAWAPALRFRDATLYESALQTPFGRLVLLGAEEFTV